MMLQTAAIVACTVISPVVIDQFDIGVYATRMASDSIRGVRIGVTCCKYPCKQAWRPIKSHSYSKCLVASLSSGLWSANKSATSPRGCSLTSISKLLLRKYSVDVRNEGNRPAYHEKRCLLIDSRWPVDKPIGGWHITPGPSTQ